MLNRNQFYFDRREQIPTGAENDGPEEKNIVTFVSRQTKGDIHSADSRRAAIYRQALSIMPASSENEKRSNYIAAGMIVTVLGGWLGSLVLKSRAFTTLTFILLFFFGAALAGLFLGAVLGKGFIPVEPMQVALFAIAGTSVFILGVGLSLMLWSKREDAREPLDQTPLQQILIPVREVNPRVLIPVQEVNAGALIPVKELNPHPHAGRRITD